MRPAILWTPEGVVATSKEPSIEGTAPSHVLGADMVSHWSPATTNGRAALRFDFGKRVTLDAIALLLRNADGGRFAFAPAAGEWSGDDEEAGITYDRGLATNLDMNIDGYDNTSVAYDGPYAGVLDYRIADANHPDADAGGWVHHYLAWRIYNFVDNINVSWQIAFFDDIPIGHESSPPVSYWWKEKGYLTEPVVPNTRLLTEAYTQREGASYPIPNLRKGARYKIGVLARVRPRSMTDPSTVPFQVGIEQGDGSVWIDGADSRATQNIEFEFTCQDEAARLICCTNHPDAPKGSMLELGHIRIEEIAPPPTDAINLVPGIESGMVAMVIPSERATAQRWDLTMERITSGLQIFVAAFGGMASFPPLAADPETGSFSTDAEHHTSKAHRYLGVNQMQLAREMSIDFGEVLPEEMPGIDAWATGCLRYGRPFFFAPDEDDLRQVYFGWQQDPSFSAPYDRGLHKVSPVKFKSPLW